MIDFLVQQLKYVFTGFLGMMLVLAIILLIINLVDIFGASTIMVASFIIFLIMVCWFIGILILEG